MNGDKGRFCSILPEREVGNALVYTFSGTVSGEAMSGDLDLGEYLKAKWSAGNTSMRRSSVKARIG